MAKGSNQVTHDGRLEVGASRSMRNRDKKKIVNTVDYFPPDRTKNYSSYGADTISAYIFTDCCVSCNSLLFSSMFARNIQDTTSDYN